ncbi:MAG: hypothetical protein DWB43_14415 [Lautropia sp.]|nr:hypothetical protein [Lautropia sp.]MCL4702565.1 hypothetical protein [Burkholderiaceae bacterium]RIK87478.1 MAG: hypothetical protein DCC70_12215 [Burkholderiales bacterium]
MASLADDYPRLLSGRHEPPCLSLYQPTHRVHPDNQQDPIRFRNLVKALADSLLRKYPARDGAALLAPFEALAADHDFWNHTLDGLAVLAAPGFFRAWRLQRPVAELTVVADSFHTKPLMRILQSADRYHILGLNRHEARLFEGNRDAIAEVDLAIDSAAPAPVRERATRVYGSGALGATTRHGTDLKQAMRDRETEHFFRTIDADVLEHYSRPTGLPLLLAALPEHHRLFRGISRNPMLAADALDVHPDDLSLDQLRTRAWALVEPWYLARLAKLVNAFEAARPKRAGSDDLHEVAKAAAAGQVATLLIEADRIIPGRFDPADGSVVEANLADPEVDDLLDDIGERVIATGGEVVIVPAARMPTITGLAAIYRFPG